MASAGQILTGTRHRDTVCQISKNKVSKRPEKLLQPQGSDITDSRNASLLIHDCLSPAVVHLSYNSYVRLTTMHAHIK